MATATMTAAVLAAGTYSSVFAQSGSVSPLATVSSASTPAEGAEQQGMDTPSEADASIFPPITDKPEAAGNAIEMDEDSEASAAEAAGEGAAGAITKKSAHPSVKAAENGGAAIRDIKVKGNQRIESDTVISFLGLRPGDKVSARRIDAGIASVFASGLFGDASAHMEGSTLVVDVAENPLIGEVAFEGNKRLSDDDLKNETHLAPRAVYNKTDVQQDVKRILDLYQKNGRYSAVVTPKIIQLDHNRVNLVFEIDEGDRSKITRISFVGNSAFSTAHLRHIIKTKESAWWRFLSSDDTYDQDRLSFDQELLRRFYVAHGYADFRVISSTADLAAQKDAFYITFTVEEGKKYKFGKMQTASELQHVEGSKLQTFIKSKEGDIFNAEQVDATVESMTGQLGNMGFAFVAIDPQLQRDPATNTIGINYVVKEGPRAYIENIAINGNVRTLDEVVRREFRVAEGDPYNAEKLKRSKQRVDNLGFFRSVDMKTEQGSAPDKVNVNMNVEEQSTGELTFGAGFSTTEGIIGDIALSERNLLGTGQFVKLNLTAASVRQEVDFSYTQPYFMDHNIAAGIDLFKVQTNTNTALTDRTYNSDTLGGTLRANYSLTEHLDHGVRYSLKNSNITNIQPTASTFIRQQAGKYSTSLVGHTLSWDTRDNNFNPKNGHIVRLLQDAAGLGGDAKYLRNEVRSAVFFPLSDSMTLKLAAKGGYVFGLGGESVRINDRFFINSNDLRGFANEGVGPRDATSRDPLGGQMYGAGTVEVNFPLGLPEELGFTGSVFTDLATLYKTDDKQTATAMVLDTSAPRGAAGVGLGWSSPLGPIRIDFAVPYMKENYDKTEQVKFSFGTRF